MARFTMFHHVSYHGYQVSFHWEVREERRYEKFGSTLFWLPVFYAPPVTNYRLLYSTLNRKCAWGRNRYKPNNLGGGGVN